MKTGIHPRYEVATAVCACGNTFQTRSTRSNLRTDICGVCHPFYTGEQRIIDTAGQVERFMKRMEASQATIGQTSKRQQRIQEQRAAAAEEQARAREAAARERAAAGAALRERRAAMAPTDEGAPADGASAEADASDTTELQA